MVDNFAVLELNLSRLEITIWLQEIVFLLKTYTHPYIYIRKKLYKSKNKVQYVIKKKVILLVVI